VAVEGILSKYETKEELAKGYKHIQQLATKKGEELKAAQRELAVALDLRDRFFEKADNGELVLKTDAAVAALQRGTPPPAMIDQAQFMQQAAAEQREYLEKTLQLDEADIDDAMDRSAPAIQARAQQLFNARQAEIRNYQEGQRQKAAQVVNNFFTQNPKYLTEEVKQVINAWYSRFPEHLQPQLILHNLMPLEQVAKSAFQQVNFEKAVREAYQEGVKAGERSIEPTPGSAPTPGQRAPSSRGAAQDPDSAIKQGIVGAGVLPSIFDELE
jgi:hypothetical protein